MIVDFSVRIQITIVFISVTILTMIVQADGLTTMIGIVLQK